MGRRNRNRNKPVPKEIAGSQRGVQLGMLVDWQSRFDLEIAEHPIRVDAYTQQIIEANEYCYEVRSTLSIMVDDALSSTDGDDQGFTVAPDFNLGSSRSLDFQPINKETYQIALDVITRRQDVEDMVIGGDRLKKAARHAIGHGDSFLELGIEKEGIGRNDWCVARTLYLPKYEIFRVEDDQGYLERFEQRKMLDDKDPVMFDPSKIVHFRYEPTYLYGNSAWKPAIALGCWQKLKEATEILAIAMKDVGMNPNIHEFESNFSQAQRERYINEMEMGKRANKPRTDFYLLPGMKLSKLSSTNPDLTTLVDNVLHWRLRMSLSGVPVYFFPGLIQPGPREISAQPAFLYARRRNMICALLAKGIRQVIDTEIVLKKGYEWYRENGQYRIIFPQWNVDMQAGAGAASDESKAAGFSDLEENLTTTQDAYERFIQAEPRSNYPIPVATANGNGNGNGRGHTTSLW